MVLSAFGPAKQCLSTAAAIYQVRSIAERAIQIISTASQVFGWVMNLPYDGSDLGTRMAKSIPSLLGIITRIITLPSHTGSMFSMRTSARTTSSYNCL